MLFPLESVKLSKESFYLLQPVLVCSRIFGLCPVIYKNCGHFYTIEWSSVYQIYSVLVPICLSLITMFSMADVLEDSEVKTDLTRRYLTSSDIITINLIVLFCIFATPSKMKAFWKICKYFSEIEGKVIIQNPRRHRITSIVFISTVIILYSIFYLVDILTWHTSYEKIDGIYSLFKDYIPFYLLKYIMLMEILFFCHLVYFTKIRLSYLNESLQKIIGEKIFDVSSFHNGEIKVLPPPLSYNWKINDIALRICELTKAHRKLFEVVQIMNGTGEFGIVIILFCLMVHLIASPYFVFSELEKGKDASMTFVSLQCMWIVAHAGKFFIILESCHSCGSEAENLFMNVQKLFAEETVIKTKKALLILIMQLKLCKTQLSVLGLFKLERSLLTGFVASITTYLVVLLQID